MGLRRLSEEESHDLRERWGRLLRIDAGRAPPLAAILAGRKEACVRHADRNAAIDGGLGGRRPPTRDRTDTHAVSARLVVVDDHLGPRGRRETPLLAGAPSSRRQRNWQTDRPWRGWRGQLLAGNRRARVTLLQSRRDRDGADY